MIKEYFLGDHITQHYNELRDKKQDLYQKKETNKILNNEELKYQVYGNFLPNIVSIGGLLATVVTGNPMYSLFIACSEMGRGQVYANFSKTKEMHQKILQEDITDKFN